MLLWHNVLEYEPELGHDPVMNERDKRCLRAAEGWLELDEPLEAARELEDLPAANQAHPAVLLLRCQMYLATHRPDYTHTIASTLTDRLPDLPDAWFFLACASARLNQNEEAGVALKRCFVAATKKGREEEWQKRALATRELDGYWCEQQRTL